ncbi:MAG: Helicase associated domain protein, partial [Oscillospiraceae bacterium]
MGMHLFEHNRTAYKNCVAMLDAVGKAAVIHPTGTGKSFIGFKLCEDNPEKTICWLSPSEYIFRTQLENLAETSDGYQPENIKFFTYAKLTLMTDDEISEIKPDYIILDEFHRCGAELWGMSVQKLLLSYKNAPVLGMSATAIRYLDNQRNMADELFDGNIASEMTLGEAIVRGILNAPKYVLSLFSYKETLEKYEIRVQKTQSKPVRDKAEKYLEKLRRALEKSEGLDKIFDKHMTDRTGKYIVFTANFESMQETIAKVLEWFHLVDEKPHIYSVYSDDSSANQSFIDFKADNDKQHLKLLFCIDALNEGIHVENISGVILLRPTVSPIIYKQQIGRALSASKSGVPVIFDIVNNIQNLYSIDSVREEMRDALHYFHEFERDDEIVNETFEIIDEVQDCLKLFHKLEETLTASWDIMFMEAEKYYREHGNLNLSGTYITENGYHLGLWVTVQRRNYHAHQYMSDARIRRLESIGMDWTPVEERIWNETYEICRKYYEQHHTLTGIKQYSKSAGNWLVTQRAKYNSGELKAERIEKLNQIGMIWD